MILRAVQNLVTVDVLRQCSLSAVQKVRTPTFRNCMGKENSGGKKESMKVLMVPRRGGTMNRMRDRMRVIFITIAIICSYIVYFYTKSRTTDIIAIDRAAIDSAHK
ncbi:hypothetical protein ANCCAN_11039 [Ancylostoma caninum]|uniref:Uncharacterized protein n=1 Tax=Ancylostoma caninum TaxID=29170 RepID=A0A368GF50_ANCCA|nr:hypothetical protein ANCCAN_11039 [Ancylostoma caninum]